MSVQSMAMQQSVDITSTPPSTGRRVRAPILPFVNFGGKDLVCRGVKIGRKPCGTRQICTGLLSMLAVVAITLNFFRICYGVGGRADVPRRLADRGHEKEHHNMWDIIRECMGAEDESDAAYLPQTEVTPHPSWQPTFETHQGQQTTTTLPWLSAWETTTAPFRHAPHPTTAPCMQKSEDMPCISTGTVDVTDSGDPTASWVSSTLPSGELSSSTVQRDGCAGGTSSPGGSFLPLNANSGVLLDAEPVYRHSLLNREVDNTLGNLPGTGFASTVSLSSECVAYQDAHPTPQQRQESHTRLTVPSPSAAQALSEKPSLYLTGSHQQLTSQPTHQSLSWSLAVDKTPDFPAQTHSTPLWTWSEPPSSGDNPVSSAGGPYISLASRRANDTSPLARGKQRGGVPFAPPDVHGDPSLLRDDGNLGLMISGVQPTNPQPQSLPVIQPNAGNAQQHALHAGMAQKKQSEKAQNCNSCDTGAAGELLKGQAALEGKSHLSGKNASGALDARSSSTFQGQSTPSCVHVTYVSGSPRASSTSTGHSVGCSGGATSSERPLSSQSAGAEVQLNLHPFFRLPILRLLEGDYVRRFRAEDAFKRNKVHNSPNRMLEHICAVFAKESITAKEADKVVIRAQRLVGHLFYRHQAPVKDVSPAEAAGVLGRRYLMLDAVVSAIQLLGPAMEASIWWQKLASVICSDVGFGDRPIPFQRSQNYAALAKRLSAAIDQLKTGTRPGAAETVFLKRELFCMKSAPPEFKRPRWDAWRREDRKATGDHGGCVAE